MAERLTGALYTYQTHVLYVGALIASTHHKHHAGQVMWVPGGLSVEDDERHQHHSTTHVIAPDRSHSHGAATAAAVLWVDRDDLHWDRAQDMVLRVPTHLEARLGESMALEDARVVARALLAAVAPTPDTFAARHPAVKRMCAMLDDTASERAISLTQLAQRSGLSTRQLRHRFTEELGINPRAYLRWRRLRRAIAAIEQGATLTQAAADGGFADSAHFSRVFQAQFGMAPSQALSSVRFAGTLA